MLFWGCTKQVSWFHFISASAHETSPGFQDCKLENDGKCLSLFGYLSVSHHSSPLNIKRWVGFTGFFDKLHETPIILGRYYLDWIFQTLLAGMGKEVGRSIQDIGGFQILPTNAIDSDCSSDQQYLHHVWIRHTQYLWSSSCMLHEQLLFQVD